MARRQLRRTLSLFQLFVFSALFFTSIPLGAQEEGASSPEEAVAGEPAGEEPNALTRAMNRVFGDGSEEQKGLNYYLGTQFLFRSITGDALTVLEVDRQGNPVIDEETGEQSRKVIAVPFILVVLVVGSVFFTIWFRLINVRGFKHSLDIIAGKYDNPDDPGEISHFRALTSALSATVGLGNIGGVALAIQVGGPGAVFWMWMVALFGMTAKFSSCTLSQLYRKTNADGTISGGPMYYLDIGLKERGLGVLGKFLGVMFAIMVMGGALGGGNMFQANQSFEAIHSSFGVPERFNYVYGLIMAVLVGLVVVGGIRRIGAATSRIVPAMCGIYVVASLFIIIANIENVPRTFALIVRMAFTDNAYFGLVIGVIVMGVRRGAFSNEAGLGSASIAHAAAKTQEPVREGLVAMIGPFIDTIIICTMTALVVLVTGTWEDEALAAQGGNIGVTLTTEAFRSVISWFPYLLTFCIVLFAYSTMISWCYYGERGWIYLMDHFGGRGLQTVIVFRIIFVIFVFIGAVTALEPVVGFSDIMIFSMAFPNIVGSIILAPVVSKKLKDYWGRYTSGEMKPLR